MSWRNLPNIITLLRITLIFPFLWAMLAENYQLAFLIFALAGCSDGIDGFLARQYNWTSRFGSMVDPLADKLLLMSSFIVLAIMGHIPYWLMYSVIFRDIWIMSGVVAYHFIVGDPDFKPSWLSKLNTTLQIVFVVLVLLDLGFWQLPTELLMSLAYLIFATTLLSLINYTWVWGRRAYFNVKQKGE